MKKKTRKRIQKIRATVGVMAGVLALIALFRENLQFASLFFSIFLLHEIAEACSGDRVFVKSCMIRSKDNPCQFFVILFAYVGTMIACVGYFIHSLFQK